MSDTASKPRAPTNAYWMLALLALMLVASFLDRTVLALLVAPIKQDLGISDGQFALLYGLAFAIFFGLIGLPIARYVDRGNRKVTVLVGVILWAVATAASGFANSFAAVLVLRMLLAVGEGVLSPATASLITDLFPLRQRVFAASVYATASQVGSFGSFAIGGLLIASIGTASYGDVRPWQMVMIAASVPAFALAILFALTTREPARRETGEQHGQLSTTRGLIAYLAQHRRLYTGYLLGASGPAMVVFAYSAWMPELVRRTFSLEAGEVGVSLGLIGAACGVAGTFIAPALVNLSVRRRPDAPVLINLSWFVLGAGAAIALPLQPTIETMLVCYGATIFLLAGAINNNLASLQLVAPREAMGTMHTLGGLCVTVLGLGIGPSAAAALAQATGGPSDGLTYGLLALAPIAIIPSLVLLAWARRPVYARVAQVLADNDAAAAAAPPAALEPSPARG